MQLPDNPLIARTEREGVPDGRHPICPICGEECDTYYRNGFVGDIVGCDFCISEHNAWDVMEEEMYDG
jgi:hypothetical protein